MKIIMAPAFLGAFLATATAAPTAVGQASTPAAACSGASFSQVEVAAAAKNSETLQAGAWVFDAGTEKKPEGPGWEMYVPLVSRTISTQCAPDSPGFARALMAWQSNAGVAVDGKIGRSTAVALRGVWQNPRAHLRRKARRECIELPKQAAEVVAAENRFAPARTDLRLEPATLAAYRAMLSAAKAEAPGVFAKPDVLTIASAHRTREEDLASCRKNPGTCNGIAKAADCSAHWSGRAIDINVGFLAQHNPTDSQYQNRVFQSQTRAYLWLLANAGRFGFVNYFYEPWHWEWQGQP